MILRWAHPSCPTPLGAKHKRIIAKQLGIPEWGYLSTYSTTGKWYIIWKPEHLVGYPSPNREEILWLIEVTGSADLPWVNCPFCDGRMYDSSQVGICTPIHCYSCGRTGWVYDECQDAHVNWDDYHEQFNWIKTKADANRAVDERGCPRAVADILGQE